MLNIEILVPMSKPLKRWILATLIVLALVFPLAGTGAILGYGATWRCGRWPPHDVLHGRGPGRGTIPSSPCECRSDCAWVHESRGPSHIVVGALDTGRWHLTARCPAEFVRWPWQVSPPPWARSTAPCGRTDFLGGRATAGGSGTPRHRHRAIQHRPPSWLRGARPGSAIQRAGARFVGRCRSRPHHVRARRPAGSLRGCVPPSAPRGVRRLHPTGSEPAHPRCLVTAGSTGFYRTL